LKCNGYIGEKGGDSEMAAITLEYIKNRPTDKFFDCNTDDFRRIPSNPVAYWVSKKFIKSFDCNVVAKYTYGQGKNVTSNNEKYLRYWWEVSFKHIGRENKWLPYAKGGDFRKWFGNIEHVVDWSKSARKFYKTHISGRIISEEQWYLEGITWTDITSTGTGFRYLPQDMTFDTTGLTIFVKDKKMLIKLLGILNTNYSFTTVHFLKQAYPSIKKW